MSVKSKPTDSHVWKSILKSRSVLEKGLGKNVGNGHHTYFWTDNWLNCGPLLNHALKGLSDAKINLPVASYCDEVGNWDLKQMEQELPTNIILTIIVVMIDPTSNAEDTTL